MKMRCAVVLVSIVFGCMPIVAQTVSPADVRTELEWYKQRTLPIIAELRTELRKPLTAEQRDLESSIDYKVVIDGNCNAFAVRRGGTPIIETTAGFAQVIDWVATAMIAGQQMQKAECFGEYLDYLTGGILSNSDRMRAHEQLKPVASLFRFAQSNRDICAGVTQQSFRATPGADDMRELLFAGSIKFLLAHELGHHVFGHVGHKPSTVAAVREQERQADEFAFREMALSGTNPIEGMPVLILFGALEGFSIEGEERRDHPAGVRRFVTMVEAGEALIKNDDTAVAYMRAHGTYDKFVAGLRQMREHLRQMEAGR